MTSFQEAVYKTEDPVLINKYENRKAKLIQEQEAKKAPQSQQGQGIRSESVQSRPSKPISSDPSVETGKFSSEPQMQKVAQKELKQEYEKVLGEETEFAEKPVRSGLEELGFEIKTNQKGTKYAQLGNVKISLADVPPPYSLSGLKQSVKARVASAKAAKNIQQGKTDIEGVKSEFLEDSEASRVLDQLDEKALFEEKQFIDSIRGARNIDELKALARKEPELFTYDKQGKPSKYLEEYEAKEVQLEKVQLPEPPKLKEKVRQFAKSLQESENVTPEIKAEIKKKVDEGDFSYEVRRNKELIETAKTQIETKGVERAELDLKKKDLKDFTDNDVAQAIEIGKKYQAEGKTEDAIRVWEEVAKAGTEKGRAVQAFRTLNYMSEMSPETALYSAVKQVQNYKANPKMEGKVKKAARTSRALKKNIEKVIREKTEEMIEDIGNICRRRRA